MNDKQIQKLVMDELDFEPSIDAAGIGVQAENGVVTLTGEVPSYAQKLAAERAAWRVRGVKAVVQNVAVQPAGSGSSDEQIAARALDALRWNVTLPADALHVSVDHGWVTLAGSVDWQYQRRNAEEALRFLRGVTGVTNRIELKPHAQPAAVHQRIEEALKRNAQVEARKIEVRIENGNTVVLQGKVDNWLERAAVERAAWSAPGVSSVVDRLTIV